MCVFLYLYWFARTYGNTTIKAYGSEIAQTFDSCFRWTVPSAGPHHCRDALRHIKRSKQSQRVRVNSKYCLTNHPTDQLSRLARLQYRENDRIRFKTYKQNITIFALSLQFIVVYIFLLWTIGVNLWLYTSYVIRSLADHVRYDLFRYSANYTLRNLFIFGNKYSENTYKTIIKISEISLCV